MIDLMQKKLTDSEVASLAALGEQYNRVGEEIKKLRQALKDSGLPYCAIEKKVFSLDCTQRNFVLDARDVAYTIRLNRHWETVVEVTTDIENVEKDAIWTSTFWNAIVRIKNKIQYYDNRNDEMPYRIKYTIHYRKESHDDGFIVTNKGRGNAIRLTINPPFSPERQVEKFRDLETVCSRINAQLGQAGMKEESIFELNADW